MKIIQPIEFPGVDKFKENVSDYLDVLLSGEVLAFRNANCTEEDQQSIMKFLGDMYGWWPNSEDYHDPMYYETHRQSMSEKTSSDKDSFMLGWHLEHVGHDDESYLSACWSMPVFTCSPDVGKTYFYDVVRPFNLFDSEDQKFLSKVRVKLLPKREDGDVDNVIQTYTFLQKHWSLDQYVPRPVLNNSHETKVFTVDGLPPTTEQEERFKKLFDQLVQTTTLDEVNRQVHLWQEGDMLLLDVFRLAHAVTGGFTSEERNLVGIFGIRYEK